MSWQALVLYSPEAEAAGGASPVATDESGGQTTADQSESESGIEYDAVASEIDRIADLYGIDTEDRLTGEPPADKGVSRETATDGTQQQSVAGQQQQQSTAEGQQGSGLPQDDEQLLRESGIDPNLIPADSRGIVATVIRQWWNDRYRPVAEQLQQYWQQFSSQLQAAAAMTQSREWEIAQKLVQNPQLLQQVEPLLRGQPGASPAPGAPTPHQPGAGLPQLPQINEEELTPSEKAIWQHTRAAFERANQLEQQLSQEREYVSQLEQWAQQMYQWASNLQSNMAEKLVARVEDEASREFGKAIEEASREYGFNVLEDQERFNKAVEWIEARVRSLYERHVQSGGNGDFRVNYRDLMREALKAAGYDEIAKRRRREAETTAPPPAMREGGEPQAFRDELEIINSVADELGID